MGLDIHAVNFLKVAANKQLFGNTLTIGRQKLYLIEADVKLVFPQFCRHSS